MSYENVKSGVFNANRLSFRNCQSIVVNGDDCHLVECDSCVVNGHHCYVRGNCNVVNGDDCEVRGDCNIVHGAGGKRYDRDGNLLNLLGEERRGFSQQLDIADLDAGLWRGGRPWARTVPERYVNHDAFESSIAYGDNGSAFVFHGIEGKKEKKEAPPKLDVLLKKLENQLSEQQKTKDKLREEEKESERQCKQAVDMLNAEIGKLAESIVKERKSLEDLEKKKEKEEADFATKKRFWDSVVDSRKKQLFLIEEEERSKKAKKKAKKPLMPDECEETIVENGSCVLCCERNVATLIKPCRHSLMCVRCARNYMTKSAEKFVGNKCECPICKVPITRIEKIFVS